MKRNVKVLFVVGFILIALAVATGVGATQLRNNGYSKSKTVPTHGIIVHDKQQVEDLTFSSYATFAVGVSLVATGLFLQTKRSKHQKEH